MPAKYSVRFWDYEYIYRWQSFMKAVKIYKEYLWNTTFWWWKIEVSIYADDDILIRWTDIDRYDIYADMDANEFWL